MIIFRYSILPEEITNGLKKPTIEVSLKGRASYNQSVIGLLDTGADISVIPKGVADFLNLKLGKETTANGIGGEIKVWDSHVDMKISQKNETYQFKDIPIQVSEDDTMPIIFGRNGLFEKFEIIIDESKEKVKLRRKVRALR